MQQNQAFYECPLCLEKSSTCVKFSCSHSCCSNCWKEMVKVANSDFKVNDLKCFDLQCKKKIENIDSLVTQLSNREIKDRFHYLQKKQEIINDKNKFICPNKTCNKILNNNQQQEIKNNYSQSKSNSKDIQNLDYSFMICDQCTTVFCKICEIYHEPGKATCIQAKKINSEIIIKVD